MQHQQRTPTAIISTSILLLLCTHLSHSFITNPSCYKYCDGRQQVLTSQSPIFNTKESNTDAEEDWEWDGLVVEGAHDAEFESVDNADSDAFVPSISFMAMANSVTSPALTAATGGSSTASTGAFDPLQNAGILHRMSMEKDTMDEDTLLEIGGDPAFLDDDDEEEEAAKEIDDSDFFEWDGTVDEDAHLDF